MLPATTTSFSLLGESLIGIVYSSVAPQKPITAALLAPLLLILGGIALGMMRGRP